MIAAYPVGSVSAAEHAKLNLTKDGDRLILNLEIVLLEHMQCLQTYDCLQGRCSSISMAITSQLFFIIEGVTETKYRYFNPLLGKIELATLSCIKTISALY